MRLAGFIKPLLLRVNKNKCRLKVNNYATSVETEDYALDTKDYIDFKKLLRHRNLFNKDGHTCLQLECRLCERNINNNNQPVAAAGVTAATSSTLRPQGPQAYVIKRTGKFECVDCICTRSMGSVDDVNYYIVSKCK